MSFIALKMTHLFAKKYFYLNLFLKDWVLSLEYRFIEAFKPFNDDQEFKKTLLNEPILFYITVLWCLKSSRITRILPKIFGALLRKIQPAY